MSRARDTRVRVGSGGRPANGMIAWNGDGGVSMGPSIGGGGSRALRYNPGEEDALKKEMEKTLRLRRLQQVREQSRKQAKEARQEYLHRRDESRRAALTDFRNQSEARRTAEMLTLNERLQTKLLEVGTAHRLAACTNRVRELEKDRRREERPKSAERRRTRNLAASKKRAAELMDSKKGVAVAEHRREVWREEGEEGRVRAREEMTRQESSTAAQRARAEVEARRFRQRVGENGTVQSTHANAVQSGPRVEDFKKSRVHAALVLRHGTTPGARVMGVETVSGNPAHESRRQKAQARERKEVAEKADFRAEKRGQEAFMMERDRQVVTRQEAELRRLHELDRRQRQTIGAAETNLAAKRGGRVDDSERREWPMWWPTPPPHLHPGARRRASVSASAIPVGIPRLGAAPRPPTRPSISPMPQEHERLRMLQETRQGLLRAAVRAEEQGRGRSASSVGASIGSEGDDSQSFLPVSSSSIVPSASASSVASAAAAATVAVDVVGATTVAPSFAPPPPTDGTTARSSRIPSSPASVPRGCSVSGSLPPRRSRTSAGHVSPRFLPSSQKHPSFVHQRQASEKGGRSGISARVVLSRPVRPSPRRTVKAVTNQQYGDEASMSWEQWMLESSGDVGGYDGGSLVPETRQGEEVDGEVRIPLVRQVDPGWNADTETWQVDGRQESTSEDVRSPSAALSLQPSPPPMVSSFAATSPGARQEATPSPSTVGSSPALALAPVPVARAVAVQLTPRSYVSVGVNTEELPEFERRQDDGARDRAAAEDGRQEASVPRCDSAVQVGPESIPYYGARSSPALTTPATPDPGRSVLADRKVDANPIRPEDGRGDALDARYHTSRSISVPPAHASARDAASASPPISSSPVSSGSSTLVQCPPLAPEDHQRNAREMALGSARQAEGSISGAPPRDTISSDVAELGSVRTERATPPPQLPSPAIPAIREGQEDRVRAPTAVWPPRFQWEEDTTSEGLGRTESGCEDRNSVTTSSTSTLPQLDRELTELLERHRRLDKEASKLTRCVAEDAVEWGGGASSSGTVDTSSSSSTRGRATPYRSASTSRSSVSRVRSNETEKLSQSTNDFSVAEGGDAFYVAPGMHTQHGAGTGSGLSEKVSSSARGSGIGGGEPTPVSRYDVPAETMSQSGPAAPEGLGRWREGSMGSQSALRLSGQNSGAEVRWDADVSPRGGVDTAPEVTEWARRIQASIESMNMLVDGLQVARTDTSGAGTATRTVSTPVSASSPRTDTATPGSSGRRGNGAQAGPDSSGSKEKRLRSEEGKEGPFAAPGVESFASAQLGFRRGLHGLLADIASGGAGSGGESNGALRFSPSTTKVETGADLNFRNSSASNSGDGRREFSRPASLESPPLPPTVNEEVKSRGELSPSDMRAVWKERAATETQRTGNRMRNVEVTRSSASSIGGREAASPPASGDSGIDDGREESLLSSSSTSFGGPDLSAEIASLEALGKSLQQRKIRFEPEPALLVQHQRELEDCRRSIRSTTSSSVSRKPSELFESAELDRMERDVHLHSGTEESGSESSTEDALAALDAFRAELDAREASASWERTRDFIGRGDESAPDLSREVATLPSAGGDDSGNMSFSDLPDGWSLIGEEKSDARRDSPSQSRSDGDDGDRVPESLAFSPESYDALMQEFLSLDANVIQRARVAIASPVLQNPAGAAGFSVTEGGRGGRREGRDDTIGRDLIASSELYRLGVENLAGSIRERIGERDGLSQGVLAPVELVGKDEEKGDHGEQGDKCADQGLAGERGGKAAVKEQPEPLSRSTDGGLDSDAVVGRCAPEAPVTGPVGRASPPAVAADTISRTVMIPSPTSAKRDCHGLDDDYRREGSALYASNRERDTSPTPRSCREGVGDNGAKKWVDLEEDRSRDGLMSPSSSTPSVSRHQDVDDGNSLASSQRDWSVMDVGVGGMTSSGGCVKLDGEVEGREISTTSVGLVADTSVGGGDEGKANHSRSGNESTVDVGSNPHYDSSVSDDADISGGGGAALGLVGSNAEGRSFVTEDVSIDSADSYDRGFPEVSMMRSEEEVCVGVDGSGFSGGGGSGGTNADDSEVVDRGKLEHAKAEPKAVDESEGAHSLRDASKSISGEQGRLVNWQDVSWSSVGGDEECEASRSSVGFVSETEGDGSSPGAQSEEKNDSWVSRSRPGPGQAGSDGGNVTRTGEDSLEVSEWSPDSMVAERSQPKGGVDTVPSPKSGVAIAWDLGGPVSAGVEPAVGMSRDSGPCREGEGDLAKLFRRRAPGFVERSQAREKELRQRKEAREEARVKAATEAKAAAAAKNAAIPSPEPCEARSSPPNEKGRRKKESVTVRGRSDGAGFGKSFSDSAEGDGGRRKVSMKEARQRTARLYNSLPEVIKQREAEESSKQRIRRLLKARESERQRSRLERERRRGEGGGGGRSGSGIGDGT